MYVVVLFFSNKTFYLKKKNKTPSWALMTPPCSDLHTILTTHFQSLPAFTSSYPLNFVFLRILSLVLFLLEIHPRKLYQKSMCSVSQIFSFGSNISLKQQMQTVSCPFRPLHQDAQKALKAQVWYKCLSLPSWSLFLWSSPSSPYSSSPMIWLYCLSELWNMSFCLRN